MVTHTLRNALSALAPETAERLLLRACLGRGSDCRTAWAEFHWQGHDLAELFRTDRGELKRLGPLLLDNLRRNGAGVGVDAPLLTVLRTGLLREELRARIYQDVLADVARALDAAGVEFLLVGGAALGAWAYDDPALRHSHDIDVLVADEDLDAAAAAIRAAGFTESRAPAREFGPAAGGRVVELAHATTLPVRLRTWLYELSCHPSSFAALRAGSREVTIRDLRVRALGAEESLAYAAGQACISPRRQTLQWACDVWTIARTAGVLDPDRIVDTLSRARLLLPAAVLLRALVGLGAPIPTPVMTRVERAAEHATRFERDLALHGLRRAARGGLAGAMRRMPGARARLATVAWVMFPSMAYMRWSHRPRHRLLAPLSYVWRLAECAAELVSGRITRSTWITSHHRVPECPLPPHHVDLPAR